ncbi:unnamed protein product, partial [Oppiella nova]
MAGFDDLGVFFNENLLNGDIDGNNANGVPTGAINTAAIKRRFKEFLRQYNSSDSTFQYKYRQQIRDRYNLDQF